MKILFTGASSFSGFWYVKALCARGHELFCTFTKPSPNEYDETCRERIESLPADAKKTWACPTGSEAFKTLVESSDRWDSVCLHGASVGNYKSPDFNVFDALRANTAGIAELSSWMSPRGCRAAIATGSYSEADEGCGTTPLKAFAPYGLSKTLSFEYTRFHFLQTGISTGKFVMPNPFGAYEKPGSFTTYLAKCWAEGKTPKVRTPDYIRDNIHVSLLAEAYADFVETTARSGFCSAKINPGEYRSTQKEFALMFARQIGDRLGLETPIDFAVQSDFSEPMARTNTLDYAPLATRWNESAAWDFTAAYYARKYNIPPHQGTHRT